MIIFSTTDELRDYIAIDADLYFSDIAPSLKQAARKRVVSVIGKTLATEVETYYNNGSPDQNDESKLGLLKLLQEAVANFGLETYIPEGNVSINSQGITMQVNETSKPADWGRIKDLTRKHAQAGEDVLEEVINYLEEEGSFTAWNDSDERKSWNELPISSIKEFREYYSGLSGGHITFRALAPIQRDVRNMYLEPSFTPEFLEEALAYTVSNVDQYALLKLIKHAAANFTISRACRSMAFELTPDGFRKRLVTTFNSMIDKLSDVAREDLSSLETHTAKAGNAYLLKAIDFLNQKATDSLFATWKNSDKYVDPTTAEQPSVLKGKGGFVGF